MGLDRDAPRVFEANKDIGLRRAISAVHSLGSLACTSTENSVCIKGPALYTWKIIVGCVVSC